MEELCGETLEWYGYSLEFTCQCPSGHYPETPHWFGDEIPAMDGWDGTRMRKFAIAYEWRYVDE